ncbi:MAG: glycosyltransferase [Pararhodobacter sp.]|nr:glycosyltransferase [Pararhodobacter sp.]
MDFSKQVSMLRASGEVHTGWYERTYPDVVVSGLHPAEHYLRFGAMLGRRPRRGFDTTYYLNTYPDVAESGLNPLVHYILHGKQEGRRTQAPKDVSDQNPEGRVELVRHKLLSLGMSFRAKAELADIVRKSSKDAERGAAAQELACWAMRARTRKGYTEALEHIELARGLTPDPRRQTQLVTLALLCHLHLKQPDEAQAFFHRAASEGLAAPDVMLAWTNFFVAPEDRLARMNLVLSDFGIPELALLPDDSLPPYDRLTGAEALPPVIDGPKVSVLVAAFNAAETLPTALRALGEQTWRNLEIFVLDDCSTDDTAAVAERFAAMDPRIRLVRMARNAGAYVARNEGLDLATGDFVTLHDADDWAHPLRIETQVRHMQEHEEVIGCTTQQARVDGALGFTRWTGAGHFIIPNTSSFLFRRAPMREHLGYWDTARFSSDQELIRRMKRQFGRKAVVDLASGPLAFQRDSGSSIVADDALGINGFLFGARKEYHDAQQHHHASGASLKYGKDPAQRPFPAPAIMHALRAPQGTPRHFPVVIASDFRMDGGSIESCIQEIRAARAAGHRVGLIELYRYDLGDRTRRSMAPQVRALVDGDSVEVLTYGEQVRCDLLVVRYPPVLQNRATYLPAVEANSIKVVVNQPPVSDYSSKGVVRYTLERCAANLRHYFGKDAVWHPNGPMVREALVTHHADQLKHIELSPDNWDNIIHLPEWQRGPRQRGPEDRLRIGRHTRDADVKWPATAEDIAALYPDSDEIEVHVLGGAETPARILGYRPRNWVVHSFNAISPKDFLKELDVFVFFAHPDWVESFPRVVLEAMAVGVPVILPESHRPLFGDRALYATPQTALDVARRLHADPVAYDAQVRRAWDYLEAHYSYAMHARRLHAAGVGRFERV